jgi:tripartite-type tricarboxylate transporter receptor subunit TctC
VHRFKFAVVILAALGLLAALSPWAPAHAQDYPGKPIHFIVPYPAGGLADVMSRSVALKLTEAWGQPVIVENKPGAGGNIAAELVARSAPDGYTLLLANTQFAINPHLYKDLTYNPQTAFAPVMHALSVPNILIIRKEVPATTLAEFIALAKAQPGKLNFASAGSGSFPHLAVELFMLHADVKMHHIPYRGAAPALTAILAKEVEVLSSDIPGALQYVQSGEFRALAITSTKRSPILPNVPTMEEAGLRGYEAVGWQGFMAPAATPRAIVDKLNRQMVQALNAPDLRERMLSQGVQIVAGTPDEFAKFFREDTERWGKTVAASGAKVE